MPSAYCHSCQMTTFSPIVEANSELKCPSCHGDFVEYLDESVSAQQTNQQQNTSNASSGQNPFFGMPFFGFENFGGSFASGSGPGRPQTFTQTFSFSTNGPSRTTTRQQQESGNNGNQQQSQENLNDVLQQFMRAFMPPPPQREDDDREEEQDDDMGDPFGGADPFARLIQNIMQGGGMNFMGGAEGAQGFQMGDYFMGGNMDDVITRLMEQFNGPVGEPPASEKALAKVKEYTITKQDVDQQLECSVCLEQFKVEEKVKEMPECHHKFHDDCLMPWLKEHNACPVCRRSIEDPDRKEQEELHRRSGQSDNNNSGGNGGNAGNNGGSSGSSGGGNASSRWTSSFMNMFA